MPVQQCRDEPIPGSAGGSALARGLALHPANPFRKGLEHGSSLSQSGEDLFLRQRQQFDELGVDLTATDAYSKGQMVSFNGALYQTLADVPAGTIPRSKLRPREPRGAALSQADGGSTSPEDYLDQDLLRGPGHPAQRRALSPGWSHLGGGYFAGQRALPDADRRWHWPVVVRAQELTNGNLQNISGALSSVEFRQIFAERNRVKQHRLRIISTGAPPAAGVALVDVVFPDLA